MCILLVDDEDLIREILAYELDFQGFEVCEAETGDQAAALIKNPPKAFSLLITDIHMSGNTNGIEVGRLMRLHHPALPIIYTTGRLTPSRRLVRWDRKKPWWRSLTPDGNCGRRPTAFSRCLRARR
jgi:DNA-binding response OmpR family regulator